MSSSSTLLLLHLVLVLGLAAPPARTHPLDADVSHVSDIAADASHDSDVAHDVDPVEGSAEEEAVHHHHAHHPEPEATPMFPFFGSYVYQRLQESLQQVQKQLDNMWDMSLNSSALLELADDYDDSAWHQRVVNGTVVTVNETVKKVTLEGVQSVYQIRVISLRPQRDADAATPDDHADVDDDADDHDDDDHDDDDHDADDGAAASSTDAAPAPDDQ